MPKPPRAFTQYRLEHDAARHSLREANSHSLSARAAARHSRAELARMQSQYKLGAVSVHDVNRARAVASRAQDEARAAAANVRARRAQVSAARTNIAANGRDPYKSPFARLTRLHEEITAQWMEYETDPAKVMGFPGMSDASHPLTGAYLEAQQRASWLRPDPNRKVTPAEFARYRDSVAQLQHTFAVAEANVRGIRRPAAPLGISPSLDAWAQRAQELAEQSSDAIGKATVVARSWWEQVSQAVREAWKDGGSGRPPKA